MTYKTFLGIGATALILAGCGGTETDAPATETPSATETVTTATDTDLHPKLSEVAAATYSIETTHAFLTAKVGHSGGISDYRISLTDFQGTLDFDPASPETSKISVTINPMGVETNYPGDYKATHANSDWETWNEDVSRDGKWLNADAHPEITFVSTSATRTGDLSGTVTGDLTFLGVTKPITMDVTYNGVANPPWYGERDVIGFDASTTFKRSDFGMTAAIPNISDEVEITFSGEFLQDE